MTNRSASDHDVGEQIAAARKRAADSRKAAPHARSARYSAKDKALVITLTNGGSFTVPISRIPGLREATAASLSKVEVGAAGLGVHWEALDVDLSVAGLAELVLGRDILLRAAGAARGRTTSAAKADAARQNGLKGGRPSRNIVASGKKSASLQNAESKSRGASGIAKKKPVTSKK